MVRAMVAAMVEVGRGKLTADKVATILAGLDRGAAPANAPPGGLYLVEVRY
jgi:tRNA pseudouridine38-40 synthase